MMRLMFAAFMTTLLFWPVGNAGAANLALPPQVILRPSAIHPGGSVYVSGRRFAADQRVVMQVACPSLNPQQPRPLIVRWGPRANTRGTFAGFRLKTPSVGRGHCTVYAGEGRMGVLTDAIYRVVPATQKLPRCSKIMCLHVRAFLVRLKNGTQGTVVVTAWPGARVRIVISGPSIKTKVRIVRLDWRGVAQKRLRVALGVIKSIKAHVVVTARLGKIRGSARAKFAVIPGGR
jgi:hypothetical protein